MLELLRAAVGWGDGGLSRLELAGWSGLTPQAVSKIAGRLRGEGLVEEAGRRASTGGKPSTGLRLAADAWHAVGVHLDGATLTAVRTDLAGRVLASRSAPLDLGRPVPEALDAIVREIRVTLDLAPRPVLGVGVGTRGPLDHTSGTLHRVTGHPHWSGVRLADELTARLGLPVTVDKDTNTAALAILAARSTSSIPAAPAALTARPARPARPTPAMPAAGPRAPAPGSFGYLHLGAGLGAALVLDGKPYRGGRTGAGEFGHQAVAPDGPLCACGNRGCLEVLCLAAVDRGDLAGAARVLGIGAANLVALLDIDQVILGGRTPLAASEIFRREVAAVLAERGRAVPVTLAAPLAVPEGAALLALTPLFTRATLHRPARTRRRSR
ncbi:ROK family protein [Streptomyces sp. NBC_01190]|uniref:ROK family transcriptional regulator n=1 Tax=Streptomyces sp. NBC_01190 TaxID=2903767 RepID=UPI00386B551D